MAKYLVAALAVAGCGQPAAPRTDGVVIDRFSDAAGHLMRRSANPRFPGPGEPIDFDHPPLITQGLAPDGAPVRYYNFDIQSPLPTTLYRFVRAGTREPVAGQLDVVDAIPGDADYSDFARVAWVEVPPDFAPGSVTSAAQVAAGGYHRVADRAVIDCPIVPPGSTAREGQGVAPAAPRELWYRGARVACLEFAPPLAVDERGRVPTSPIYVTFAVNPGAPAGGPASGFRTESNAAQTHNVVMSVPGDVDYSPLWAVHVYDRAAFAQVHDAASALAAPLLDPAGPLVNCPIVALAARR